MAMKSMKIARDLAIILVATIAVIKLKHILLSSNCPNQVENLKNLSVCGNNVTTYEDNEPFFQTHRDHIYAARRDLVNQV